jgi:hypothetical protein
MFHLQAAGLGSTIRDIIAYLLLLDEGRRLHIPEKSVHRASASEMESGLRGEEEVHPLGRLRDDPYARGAGAAIPGLKTQPETRERQPIIVGVIRRAHLGRPLALAVLLTHEVTLESRIEKTFVRASGRS